MFSKKTVADQLRSLIYVLLIASAVTFVWGAVVFFPGITASVRDSPFGASEPGYDIDQAGDALRFSAIGVAFVAILLILNYAVPTAERHAVRTSKCLVAWAWLVALVPPVAVAMTFGRLNFVRPDFVDEASAPGYLLMCVSVFLLVGVAIAATVTVALGGSLLRKPGWVSAVSAIGWGALVTLLVVGTLAFAPTIIPMRDEYRRGPVADLTWSVPSVDVTRGHTVDPAISSKSWFVTAVGLVRANDGVVETVDPFTGHVRWSVRPSGTPYGPLRIRVVGEGSVVLVQWRNLAIETIFAYAADTGRLLWKTGEIGDEPEWEELDYNDGNWTVRDPQTGAVQTVMVSDSICPDMNATLRAGTLFAECIVHDDNGDHVENEPNMLIALDRRTGAELWRSGFAGDGFFGTETFDTMKCPYDSLDLSTGESFGPRPCDKRPSTFTAAGSYLIADRDAGTGVVAVVDRAGRQGPWIDLGPGIYVFDPVGGTRDHTFVQALHGSSDDAWVVALNNSTGAVDVLVGPRAMPNGSEPRIRRVVTERHTVVIEAPWGVVIGDGDREPVLIDAPWVEPHLVIPMITPAH